MNKFWLVIVALIIIVGGFMLFSNKSVAPVDDASGTGPEVQEPSSLDGGTSAPVTQEFIIEGSAFKFAPNLIRVKKGDTVHITFKNTGGTHDFRIDEFNAATKVLKSGESETIEFIADKAGSFEYYCSVGTHRQMGMVGTIVVE